jgi:hypothetical protein
MNPASLWDESSAGGWHPLHGLLEMRDAVRVLDAWAANGVGRRAIQATFLNAVHGISGAELVALLGWSPSMVAGFLTRARVIDPAGCARLIAVGERCAEARRDILQIAVPFQPGSMRGPQPSYFYVAVGVTWLKFGHAATLPNLEARIADARRAICEMDPLDRMPIAVLRIHCHGGVSARQVEQGLKSRYRSRWRDQRQEVVCASLLPDLLLVLQSVAGRQLLCNRPLTRSPTSQRSSRSS